MNEETDRCGGRALLGTRADVAADVHAAPTASHAEAPWVDARHVFEESRPRVQGIVLLRFVTAVALTGTVAWDHTPGVFSWVAASIAIYVLNGVSDREGDRRNGSRRPLASGRLTPKAAITWAVALALTAAMASLTISPYFLGLVLAYLALGIYYSVGPRPGKDSSVMTALVLVAAGLLTYTAGHAAAGTGITPVLALLALSMSAWMIVGSLVKDLTDVEGDTASGRRTLQVRRGAPSVCVTAGAVAAIITASTVAGALMVPHTATGLLAGVIGVGTVWLIVAMHRRHAWGYGLPYSSFMFTQYAAHGVILLTI